MLWLLAAGEAGAKPSVVSAVVSPSTVASGQPVQYTVTVSEPAPVGGTEVTLRTYGRSGFPGRRELLVVPEGRTSVTQQLLLPTSIVRNYDYTLQASIRGVGGAASATLTVLGRPDTGGYGVVLVPAGSRRSRVEISGVGNLHQVTQPTTFSDGVSLGARTLNPGTPPDSLATWRSATVPKWFSLPTVYAHPGDGFEIALGLGDTPNPSGTVVRLSSDSPDVVVPATVYIPPGNPGIRVPVGFSTNPRSSSARLTARWGERVTTGDVVILGTNLPAPAPTPTATPAPIAESVQPDTTLTAKPPKSPPVSGTVSFSFVSNESPAAFDCQLTRDGEPLGGYEPCASPRSYSVWSPATTRSRCARSPSLPSSIETLLIT